MRKIILVFISVCFSISAVAQSGDITPNRISTVFEYRPAPGQFINKLPMYQSGDTQEDMNRKAEECISGDKNVLISLGGYGGYVVFGFDRPIVNVPDVTDFKILGNAFFSTSSDDPRHGGNCEPGIVMVSFDSNKNGLPDDEWFELAGSEYYKPETIKNYRLTYYKPDEDKEKVPMPGYPYISDMTYIKWESNQDEEGYLYRNVYHKQPYYPQWIDEEELVFDGTKLADNYVDVSETGTYYVQYAYPWGYADNYPNDKEGSNFNIEWAVDSIGNSVYLPVIHFVKVYTGVNQNCGWLGETSTEIMGAVDLHPVVISSIVSNNDAQNKQSIRLLKNPIDNVLSVELKEAQTLCILNALGQRLLTIHASEGFNEIDCSHLPKGLYIIISKHESVKFLKQ